MLSLNTPITWEDILSIKALGTHENVWLLTGFHQDKVVVKKEVFTPTEIKHANFAVKAIAPDAKSKALSAQELGAIDQYISSFEDLQAVYATYKVSLDDSAQKAIESFQKMKLRPDGTFVKMNAVNVQDLQGAFNSRMDGDKRDLKSFAATLNAEGGFESLGKIVAVDLFTQNTDRFWPSESGAYRNRPLETKDGDYVGTPFKTRCLGNIGNVFCINTGSGNQVGAMDFVFNNWDMNKPIGECERDTHMQWGGRILMDKVKREGFAKDIVQDLEIVLSPNRGRFSLKSKLKSDAASRVVRGMVEGAGLIKARLEAKYSPQNRWTLGARERYEMLRQVR